MSSKLHRDADLSTEPMRWTPVGASASVYTSSQAGVSSTPEHGSRQLQARLQQLETERDQIAQAAYAKGRQEAELNARQQISMEVSAVSSTLARSIDEITGMRQRFRHEAEEDVVALAIAIARRVLHRELTTSPDALLGVAKAALDKIDLREVHHVRMHPDSAPLLRENLEKIGLPRRVEVIADPGLERGGVLLETTRGTLDASVETQLAEIERGFADLVRRV